jgi:hypothetical protein
MQRAVADFDRTIPVAEHRTENRSNQGLAEHGAVSAFGGLADLLAEIRCELNSIGRRIWDLTAAYAPGTQTSGNLPEPVLLNRTMVQSAAALESILVECVANPVGYVAYALVRAASRLVSTPSPE